MGNDLQSIDHALPGNLSAALVGSPLELNLELLNHFYKNPWINGLNLDGVTPG